MEREYLTNLYNQGHQVHVVNPACIKAFAKSKLKRYKTDKVDALFIAEYTSKNHLRPYKPKDSIFKELQCPYRCLQSLKDQKTQLVNLLENEQCLPKAVQEVYKNIKDEIENQMQTIETALDLFVDSHDALKLDIKNIQTVSGIGKMTAIAILVQAPDLSSFKNARQFAAYAGLTPCHTTSGTSVKGKSRLSKMGSSVAKNYNPLLKDFAQKLAKKRKHTMVIIGLLCANFLILCLALLNIKHLLSLDYFKMSLNSKDSIITIGDQTKKKSQLITCPLAHNHLVKKRGFDLSPRASISVALP